MKTLYLDCSMGAAGDMLCAALIELMPDPESAVRELNGIGLPHVVYEKIASQKCGIAGTHLSVRVHGEEEQEPAEGHHYDHTHHHHAHSNLASIETILAGLQVSDGVKANALAVYRLIAEAESHVHGCSVEAIHFHEVGTLDAIFEYAELGAAYFAPEPADMLNDLFLGLSVIALALIIWIVILLISDPKDVIKAKLLRKKS